ncbi:HPF/RaiA family ribosome-associated protein [Pyxidicoccus sp. 3LG]
MRIEIRARHIPLTEELRTHCERRVQFALGHLSDRVKEVVLRLEDTNGPRGGVDKVSRLTLRLEHGRELTVESTNATLAAAVDRTLDRAAHAAGKLVERANRRHGASVRHAA